MNKDSIKLRQKIQEIITDTIMESSNDDPRDIIYTIIGVMEELKVGLISAAHETGRQEVEKGLQKDETAFDSFIEKHRKRFEELLKKAKEHKND